MTTEEVAAAVAKAGGWGRMFRYLMVVGGVGGVLYGLGVPPMPAVVGGVVVASGWVCTIAAGLLCLVLLVALVPKDGDK